ncbi:PIN domain-containing protein [Hymenobacter daeguensis]
MRRVVVDTNCLLASISPRSPYYRLYQLFEAEAFEWVVSNEILTEYEEQLTKHTRRQLLSWCSPSLP